MKFESHKIRDDIDLSIDLSAKSYDNDSSSALASEDVEISVEKFVGIVASKDLDKTLHHNPRETLTMHADMFMEMVNAPEKQSTVEFPWKPFIFLGGAIVGFIFAQNVPELVRLFILLSVFVGALIGWSLALYRTPLLKKWYASLVETGKKGLDHLK